MPKLTNSDSRASKLMVIAGVALLVVSVAVYARYVYVKPANVFDRMLASSLSTPQITKHQHQGDETGSLDQTLVFQAEPSQVVHSNTILRQTGSGSSTITTESIATTSADFVRYLGIKTDQMNKAGQPFDFSSVLNIWGKSDANSANGAQLFSQTALGIVPFADLPRPNRSKLLEKIKTDGVYEVDYQNIKHNWVNGRLVYAYDVSVQPVAYISMLKAYARSLGLVQLERVDPSQYADSAPLKFSFDIDVLSGQLVKITYKDSARSEAYSGYGARQQIKAPAASIPLEDLQNRLQQIH